MEGVTWSAWRIPYGRNRDSNDREWNSECHFKYLLSAHFFRKATTGLEPIGYRGALLSSLLQVNVYVTHNLLNVLVQIANKMGFKKIIICPYNLPYRSQRVGFISACWSVLTIRLCPPLKWPPLSIKMGFWRSPKILDATRKGSIQPFTADNGPTSAFHSGNYVYWHR
jgi:hypothetical protein